MEHKEKIMELLSDYGCSTAKQIANLMYRKHNITITPASISGMMRVERSRGRVGASKDVHNQSVYWVIKNG